MKMVILGREVRMTFCSNSRPLGDIVSHQLCILIYPCLLFQHKQPKRLLFFSPRGRIGWTQSISAGWGPAQALGITLGSASSLTESPEVELGARGPFRIAPQGLWVLPKSRLYAWVGQVNPAHENGGSSSRAEQSPSYRQPRSGFKASEHVYCTFPSRRPHLRL